MTSGSEVLIRNGVFSLPYRHSFAFVFRLGQWTAAKGNIPKAEKEPPVCALYSSSELTKVAIKYFEKGFNGKKYIPTIEIPDLTIVRQE
jgi:hypothetical protein